MVEVWSTGRAMAYGYDDANQLTSVSAARPSDAARYHYDAAGNPVDRAELGLDVTNSFNNLNQIVSGSWTGATVTVAGSVNYPAGSISVNNTPGTVYPDSSFDVPGVPVVPGTNTLTATYTGPAYTNAPMTATDTSTIVLGDTVYTHDANGNLTGDATFIYQYDLANQLTNVTRKSDSAVILQCRYDALGRRVEAIRADGTVDRYVYFPGSFLVLAVLDETNTCKEFYTRGPDLSGTLSSAGGIGGILACTYSNAPTAPLFHHADLMGNIIALTDSSASLLSTFRYTPFGQLTSCTGTVFPRYLFVSKEWEAEIGAVYFGYRYYVPKLESWLTRDPLGEAGGIGLYQYGFANPFLGVDPWGLFGEWLVDGLAAIGRGTWQGVVAVGSVGLWVGDKVLVGARTVVGGYWGIATGDAFQNHPRPIVKLKQGQCEFLITVTGMNTNLDDQEYFRKQIASLSPFKSIPNPVFVYNPTRYGGIGDGLQALGHEIGLIQSLDYELAGVINKASKKMEAQGCACWNIYVVAHSQGTMITKRSLAWVSEEARAHLNLVGLGGETSFGAKDAAFVHNIANENDPVANTTRLIHFPESGNTVDKFYDGLEGLDAHSFRDSYWPYLQQHDWPGFLVPVRP